MYKRIQDGPCAQLRFANVIQSLSRILQFFLYRKTDFRELHQFEQEMLEALCHQLSTGSVNLFFTLFLQTEPIIKF